MTSNPTPRHTRRDWLLAAAGSALVAACGGGGGTDEAPPATGQPAILEFSADQQAYFIGDTAQVRVRFRGGVARVDGIGPVADGQTLAITALDRKRTLRLVLDVPGQAPLTRELVLPVSYRDRWTPAGELTIAYHASAHTSDGSVFVIGGSRAESLLSSAVDRYDPATRRFERVGRMSAGRSGHRAVTLGDGRILVCGGVTSENVAPFAELIDGRSGAVSDAGRLAQPRNWHAATALADGRVLMLGGFGLDTAELWDPATNRWRPLGARLAHTREYASATLLRDGRVLVAGGRSTAEPYRFAELFDPRTETFAVLDAPGLRPRQLHTTLPLPDGRVLVLGGEDFRFGIEPLDEVLCFDPATERFTRMAPLQLPRTLASGLLLPDGEVLLCGGQTPDGPATRTAVGWRSDAQRALAPLPWQRQWHTVNRLPDGRLLVLGGDDGIANYVTQVLLYE